MATDPKLFCTEGDQPQNMTLSDILQRAWITVRDNLTKHITKNVSTADIQMGLRDQAFPVRGIIFPPKEAPSQITDKLYNEFGNLRFNGFDIGGGAPAEGEYVVISSDARMENERILTSSHGIAITDNGPGSTVNVGPAPDAEWPHLTATYGMQVGKPADTTAWSIHRDTDAGYHTRMEMKGDGNQIHFYCSKTKLFFKMVEAGGDTVEVWESGGTAQGLVAADKGTFQCNGFVRSKNLEVDSVNDMVTIDCLKDYVQAGQAYAILGSIQLQLGGFPALVLGYNQWTQRKEVNVGQYGGYNADHTFDFRVTGTKVGAPTTPTRGYLFYCRADTNAVRIGRRFATSDIVGAGGDDEEVFLFVSGAIGSVNRLSCNSGSAVFGGDMLVSGNLYVKTFASTTADAQPLGKMDNGRVVVHSSDRRLKTNLVEITGSLSKVLQLQGYCYSPVENENKRYLGLVAQEVEEVVPELTFTGQEGLMGVRYGDAVALLVESIKEQQQQINKLERRIQQLEMS